MHNKTIILITGLLCVLLAFAGCTGTPNAPVVPQGTVAAVTQTIIATSAGPDLVVSPTDSMIDAYKLDVNVDKDYLGDVIVTFQGGAGLKQVNKIDATLTRGDGLIKTEDVGIRIGDNVILNGTKITDRVMVYATMKDGKRYKIVDTRVPYKPRV
jgi:hypothetical protein